PPPHLALVPYTTLFRSPKVAGSNPAPATNVDARDADLACVLGVDLFPAVDTRASFRSAYRNVAGEKPARGLADSRPSGSLPERIDRKSTRLNSSHVSIS